MTDDSGPSNFVRERVAADVAAGRHGGRVVTRFPPEPNGYLHIGHAKAIWLDFGVAAEFGGVCALRFDDTDPVKEDVEYVEAIKRDIRWLGYDWGDRLFFASDYFDQLHAWAVQLIERGLAYVDSQSAEQIRDGRGNFYKPGVESPHRTRSVEDNLELFERMRKGEFPDGAHVLRAKIDMQHKNINFRDPPLYRIKHAHHHRTGDKWCIYPMYDYAHGQSDAIEGVTHSICTLEFEDHRPLYDWFLETLGVQDPPEQIEFAKFLFTYQMTSKRRLRGLVEDGTMRGWDDPRMPTLAGLRRRGVTPEALRAACERTGSSKREGRIDISLLEHEIREHLNATSVRRMAVLDPLKLTITNLGEDDVEWFEAPNNPEDVSAGSRKIPFCRELYIERDDFREVAPKKWFRFAPGAEVRLRYACFVKCNEVVKDDAGNVVELRCTWDPLSRGGDSPDGRKVRGTSHWVSARHGVVAEVRLYERMFTVPDPMAVEGKEWTELLNPASLELVHGVVEPALAEAEPGTRVQFERLGYFCADPDGTRERPVFNRTIGLKDSWAKLEAKAEPPKP
ncbi:MAG: glutamine--tRNA ligase/YqeY domain fusion protein [Deltaproteobacteria bacterium]|nr:glutamine--tRNA ligase/YqeY domain fusion protein [Nannocystaceae bacterium]